MNRRRKRNSQRTRVGLISPYTGDNFGDAGVMSTMVNRLGEWLNAAEITGITLEPERTSRIHGIPCVPLRPWPYRPRWMFVPTHDASDAEQGESLPAGHSPDGRPGPTLAARCKGCLKALVPGRMHQPAMRALRRLRADIVHTVRAYRLARTLDMLIVSGGGQINELWGGARGQPYALFKWALVARLAGTPFAVVSVGVGTLDSAWSRRFVRHALRSAVYTSFREPGSVRILEASGCLPRTPRIAPDLALGVQQPATPVREHSHTRVGISPIAYLDPRVWPVADTSTYPEHIEKMASVAASLLQEDMEIVVFRSATGDRLAVRDLVSAIHERSGGRPVEVVEPDRLEDLLELYRTLDAVVASRLHGVVLAHRMHVPTLALNFDRKVDAHMDRFGLGRYCLSFHGSGEEEIVSVLHAMLAERSTISAYIEGQVALHRDRIEQQFDVITRLLRGSEPGHTDSDA